MCVCVFFFCSTQFDSGNSLENNTIVWNFVLKPFLPVSPECLLTPLQVMQMRDAPVLDFSCNRSVKWIRWHSSITGNYYKFSGQDSASDLVSFLKTVAFSPLLVSVVNASEELVVVFRLSCSIILLYSWSLHPITWVYFELSEAFACFHLQGNSLKNREEKEMHRFIEADWKGCEQ
jgi:hypothetical protein